MTQEMKYRDNQVLRPSDHNDEPTESNQNHHQKTKSSNMCDEKTSGEKNPQTREGTQLKMSMAKPKPLIQSTLDTKGQYLGTNSTLHEKSGGMARGTFEKRERETY